MLLCSCLSLFASTQNNLKPWSKAASQVPLHPKGTEPIPGSLSLRLQELMALGASRSSVSLGQGRAGMEHKADPPLFPLKFPLAVRTGLGVFCLPFFFPLGGVIVYQLQCQNVPDFIYVPLV